MLPSRTIRKVTEFGIICTAVATLILAGCGGGGGGSSSTNNGGNTSGSTTTTTVTPYKGMFTSGTVSIKDANGNPVTLSSGGSIGANGTASITFPSNVAYPLTVEVTGVFLDETGAPGATGTITAGAPLRGLIPASTDALAASGIPVTVVTELARTMLPASGFSAASAVAAITGAASSVIGVASYSQAMLPPVFNSQGKTSDVTTLKLTALAHVINQQGAGANLPARLQNIATQLAAGSAVNAVIPQSAFNNALGAINGGASSVLPIGATPPSIPSFTVPSSSLGNTIGGNGGNSGGGNAGSPATITGTGSVTVTGVIASTFVPQAASDRNSFDLTVSEAQTTYKFQRSALVGTRLYANLENITVTIPSSGINGTVIYFNVSTGQTNSSICLLNPVSNPLTASYPTCTGVTISTPVGATHPVTLNFADTVLKQTVGTAGNVTLNGSLVGEISTAAAWSLADFPSNYTNMLAVSGVPKTIINRRLSSTSNQFIFSFSDDSFVTITPTTVQFIRRAPIQEINFCTRTSTTCNATVSDTSTGTTIAMTNVVMPNTNIPITGSLFIAKDSGSLTTGAVTGDFTPTYSTYSSKNDVLTIAFNGTGGMQQANISVQNGVVKSAILSDNAGNTYSCTNPATPGFSSLLPIPLCAITVSADKRTVTFNNSPLSLTTAVSGFPSTTTANGTLTAASQ